MRENSEDLRDKIELLSESVTHRWVDWDAWELEFIEQMSEKAEQDKFRLTEKQREKVEELWDRI